MIDSALLWELVTVTLALGLGAFVKGATGAGAPLIAVPIMSSFHDVTFAVVVMVLPNLALNISQTWSYRQNIQPRRIAILMCLGALPGMAIGTWLLTRLPENALLLVLGTLLTVYIIQRLLDPKFRLPERIATRVSLPIGIAGGILQGTTGTSGPLAILFLSMQNLARPMFIGTISAFFLTNAVAQAPALWAEGLLTWRGLGLSALALAPVYLGLPLGNRFGKRLSPEAFNRWVLILLAILAVRLIWRGLT
jgi:Predicted permeases